MPIQERLAARGLVLPLPPQPLGSYTAVSQAGDLLFISGQLPLQDGKVVWQGQIGTDLTVEQGRSAAELAALNVLAQINAYLDGFDRLDHIVRVDGHIAAHRAGSGSQRSSMARRTCSVTCWRKKPAMRGPSRRTCSSQETRP
ncbi:hypothetical protein AWV80_34765 [Cupriavidus sp. UYMU48A]|nr:hypothetical protein AWV80_34765 [Cupriavidus sp. UYMU48A]